MTNLEGISETSETEDDEILIGVDYHQGVLLPENEKPTKREYLFEKGRRVLERAKGYRNLIFKD